MREYFLKTERIGFSRWTEKDTAAAHLLWGAEEVTRYISASGKFSYEEIETRLQTEVENLKRFGLQYFPMFNLENGDLIGCCGFRPWANEDGTLEMGFHLRKKYWRQGFGFEGAEKIIDYGFSCLNAKLIRAGHHPSNIPSSKLIKKLGFKYTEDVFYPPTGLYHPTYMLKP